MDFNLRDHTIMLALNGSRAYGINTENSDVDLIGICAPPKEYYFGYLKKFEQADSSSHFNQFFDLLNEEEYAAATSTKAEGSVYEVSKFIRLAADCNPSIIQALFCRDRDVKLITPLGQMIRDCRDVFLSMLCKHTFSGFAFSQLKKIILHRKYLLNKITKEPAREDFGLSQQPIIKKSYLDSINAAIRKVIDGWEIDFLGMAESEKIYVHGQIESYLRDMNLYGADIAYTAASKKIGCDDNLIEILEKERRYKVAYEEYKKYLEWKKNRNPERAALEAKYGYDLKNASHLYRLLLMCREILTTGKVNVFREDREAILAVRNGAWSYDQIVEFAKKQDEELTELYKTCTILPHSPDRVKIDALCVEIIEEALRAKPQESRFHYEDLESSGLFDRYLEE